MTAALRTLFNLVEEIDAAPTPQSAKAASDVLKDARSVQDTMPDLFLDWERSAPIEKVWSAKTGLVESPYVNWRSGDHRPNGLLLALGPGIPAGSEQPEMAIEDLPVSLLARFGEDPADLDGKPAAWLAA